MNIPIRNAVTEPSAGARATVAPRGDGCDGFALNCWSLSVFEDVGAGRILSVSIGGRR
ncbi:MAG: hypothetical protein ACK4MV_07860 [Beijerinckiaceae bacterium]